MNEYSRRYEQLNSAQKEAVDTIEGPMMVVAGPGTGKTEVLAMRAANILKSTDSLPANILCLTFTESGARAMRERLYSLAGAEAYKIAVHTFHNFGSEIINAHPEFFYDGRQVSPADELVTFEILQQIIKNLPVGDPLRYAASSDDSEAIKSIRSAISALKRAGLSPDEFLKIVSDNLRFAETTEPLLERIWPSRLNAKKLDTLAGLPSQLAELSKQASEIEQKIYPPLGKVMAAELNRALEQAAELKSAKPLSAWKYRWLEKDETASLRLKESRHAASLRSLANIYRAYLDQLRRRGNYDFDDMILEVLAAVDRHPDLRYNLQEQFLYVMVDEFQDTNGSQLRLIQALGDNPVNEGRPNIMVVGDDDQAIYSFQGAEISNILTFNQTYRDVKTVVLRENYRSADTILQVARQIITQGQDRLEGRLAYINKQLRANYRPTAPQVELRGFDTPHQEYDWVSRQVTKLLSQDVSPGQIAVISRKHDEIKRLAAYFYRQGTPVYYQRQDDALAHPLINDLLLISRTLLAIAGGNHTKADELIAELLAHPAFELDPAELFKLSLKAWRQKTPWLQLILDSADETQRRIGRWLAETVPKARRWPMELCLDLLIGPADGLEAELPRDGMASPLGGYYFNQTDRDQAASQYLRALDALVSVRSRVRRRLGEETAGQLKLADFQSTLEAYQSAGLGIPINGSPMEETGPDRRLINLMTAHQSKGLEFEYVFITNLNDNIWGSSRRPTNSSRVPLPKNLPVMPAGDSDDERLRLLYVAMTRSRSCLQMTYHKKLEPSGKISDLTAYLVAAKLTPELQLVADTEKPPAEAVRASRTGWLGELIEPPPTSLADQLEPRLAGYSISATHLESFLNLSTGGPKEFLLRHLLKFPKAPTPELAFGIAVHAALKEAHLHLGSTGRRLPKAKVIEAFQANLAQCALPPKELAGMSKTGAQLLGQYLNRRYASFSPNQLAERDFSRQNSRLSEVRLTGKIDVMEIDRAAKTIKITDYKTGKPLAGWRAANANDKLKLHFYRLQLMFYKLLVESSRDFAGYAVNQAAIEFVRPDANGRAVCLTYAYDDQEYERFKKLLSAVWQRIITQNWPDTSAYKSGFSGILAFEKDLVG